MHRRGATAKLYTDGNSFECTFDRMGCPCTIKSNLFFPLSPTCFSQSAVLQTAVIFTYLDIAHFFTSCNHWNPKKIFSFFIIKMKSFLQVKTGLHRISSKKIQQ